MTLSWRQPALVAFALALSVPGGARADVEEPVDIDRIEREIQSVRSRLGIVRDFVERGELSMLERAKQRFSEGETQFLLENYEGCASLLLDSLDVPAFQKEPSYPLALFYLGESLYQTRGYMQARRYFREAISRMKPGRQFQDAIVRLIDLSDRTRDFSGIDAYYTAARAAGNVRPEVIYLYAKWTSRRTDVPFADRIARADADFARLTPGQAYYPQSLYFRGALKVMLAEGPLAQARALAREDKARQQPAKQEALKKQGEALLSEASAFFTKVLELPVPTGKDATALGRVRDLANIALARVYYELGKFGEAVDRYQEVARNSVEYNDALFETAAAFVKLGSYEQAMRTSEILLLIARDTTVAPEAQLLQANLALRLGRHDKAAQVFGEVVQTYLPVRDQIAAVLARPDPVAYFDSLLEKREGALDVRTLLPRPAQPWVAIDREVNEARAIAGELAEARTAIDAGHAQANKLLDTLAASTVNLFPGLQEGNGHAVQLSNALATLEARLVRLQVELLGSGISAEHRERLAALEKERAELDVKFRDLPRTQEQYEERKARYLRRIADLEKKSFDLRRKVDGMRAELVGLRKYWEDTKADRRGSAQTEVERRSEFDQYQLLVEQLDETRLAVDRQLASERATVQGQATGGELEEELRRRYRQQLVEMQKIITEANPQVDPRDRALLDRVGRSRVEIDGIQGDLTALRGKLRLKAQERAQDYIAKVKEEQKALDEYGRKADSVEGETRHLVGEIAYEAFRRVGRQFDDIVLKGDVGIIDVAWARKKERSDRIASLAKDSEREIKLLTEQFEEVRNDAD